MYQDALNASVYKHDLKYDPHEITKYGIHSFTQIMLAVDKKLTYRNFEAGPSIFTSLIKIMAPSMSAFLSNLIHILCVPNGLL